MIIPVFISDFRRCSTSSNSFGDLEVPFQNAESAVEESFSTGLLEHPQYTRPAEWQGRPIPEVLMSGHHGKIAEWRRQQSLDLTRTRRPDLWQALNRNDTEKN